MNRRKLALIGDDEIPHYTVARRLWELLSAVTGSSFTYDVLPLATRQEVLNFYEGFKKSEKYSGFNVAVPWKTELVGLVHELEPLSAFPAINTVYRRDGKIVGVNTDPIAAQRAVEHTANLYKCSSALVLSALGSGLPIAYNLSDNLDIRTAVYDVEGYGEQRSSSITYLTSFNNVAKHTYDLIVNATPLGRYYFDHGIAAFSSPLSLELLDTITNQYSIIQETNYLPTNTLLVQLARILGRKVVTGESMLCFRANESLRRFCGISLDDQTLQMVITEIRAYIAERETEILKLNT